MRHSTADPIVRQSRWDAGRCEIIRAAEVPIGVRPLLKRGVGFVSIPRHGHLKNISIFGSKSRTTAFARSVFAALGSAVLPTLAIFMASTPAQAAPPVLTTLHKFTGSLGDGDTPYASLALGAGGVLYGTTNFGGTSNLGTVFSLTPPSSPGGPWTESVLYSFAGGSGDGEKPTYGVLAIGTGGVLYGTTTYGGSLNAGTVFSLTPPASPGGPWTDSVLHSFVGGTDGDRPYAGVVLGAGGVLYGTTSAGGDSSYYGYGAGTVFSLTPPASPGGSWTENVLYAFTGFADGTAPFAGVEIGSGGVLYGATDYGGAANVGTVFSLTPPASPGGPWTQSVLYSFTGLADGGYPWGGVAIAAASSGPPVLYGATQAGGAAGRGTVFSLAPPSSPGGAWTESVLYSFTGLADGGEPVAPVTVGGGGTLYGAAQFGGESDVGAIFSLTPPVSPGGAWTQSVVYSFTGLGDGGWPTAGVTIGAAGVLYGNTCCGGTSNDGTLFQLVPAIYTISGQVTLSGNGLSGVTMTLSGVESGSTITDSGYYSFALQGGGGSFTVTPSLTGYAFSPFSQTFLNPTSNQTANFTASVGVTISGQITLNSVALSGVTVLLSGSETGSTITDGSGNYSLSVPPAGSYTVTPLLTGYTFSPPSQTFTAISGNQSANFSANPVIVMYTISGQVTLNGSALSGVTMTLTGSQDGSSTTDSSGNYSFTVPAGGNYTVTPSLSGFTFNPASLSFNNLSGSQSGASFAASIATSGLLFISIPPCRVVDTRDATKPSGLGPPSLVGEAAARSFTLPSGPCGIPVTAQAYSLNVTVVPQGELGYITVWPTGQSQPLASTLNSLDGEVQANAAVVAAGTGGSAGAISVFATNNTDLILDINGYFVANTVSSALGFYPMTPCRLVDTRPGAPSTIITGALVGGISTTLPIRSSTCDVPATAQAYSLNFTLVPPGPVAYLTVYPTGEALPTVSTLNDPTGAVQANAAIAPAGTGGSIQAFVTQTTDLVVDINGYFAPVGAGALSLYALPPCRVLDTRNPAGAPPFEGTINVNVLGSGCGGTGAAKAYVFNATVVPDGFLGYLTLWPQGSAQPLASTLNAYDGGVTSNMAIVSTSNTEISAFATNETYLVLDLFGYFAP